MKQVSRIAVTVFLALLIALSMVPAVFAETVGDQACYLVSYADGTNPPTSEFRIYAGTGNETVTFEYLEAMLSMTFDDQEALRIDAEFVSPARPFRLANIVIPAPADILACRDWRSTANGALLQEYFGVYSSLDMGGGPLGNIDVTRWYLWTVAPDFSSGNGNYYGYPNFVGESGPMAQMNIAVIPGMDPVFWGEYYQCDVTAQEEVAGVDCLKVEYTLMAQDTKGADPRIGSVVIEEWYPVPGDPRNPVLAPIKRIDMMNFIGMEVQTRLSDDIGPCVPEAATVAMMSIGLVGLGSFVWFRKRRFSLPSA